MCTDEQKRLTASWLNILGAGTISAGGVTQLVTITAGDRPGSAALTGVLIAVTCVIAGSCLHLLARSVLARVGTCPDCGSFLVRNKQGTNPLSADIADVDPFTAGPSTARRRVRPETLMEAFQRRSLTRVSEGSY